MEKKRAIDAWWTTVHSPMSISCSSVNMTGLFLFFLVAPDVLGCVVSSSPSSGGGDGDGGGVGDLAASSSSRLLVSFWQRLHPGVMCRC